MIPQSTAHAACTAPAGVAGDIVYNASHNVMQFCDDTNWIGMSGGSSGGGGSDTLSGLSCTDDQIIAWNGTNSAWECATQAAAETVDATGMIVAFNTASCPAGWMEVTDLAGRVPVGAGSLPGGGTYGLGDMGGNEYMTLTPLNLPSHAHSIPPVSVTTSAGGAHTHTIPSYDGHNTSVLVMNDDGGDRILSTDNATGSNGNFKNNLYASNSAGSHSHTVDIPSSMTANAGGQQPFDNRVPYRVYTYCQYNGSGGLGGGFGGGGGSADNLGDHTATQNLDIGTFSLVGNGGTVGLKINATGRVDINQTLYVADGVQGLAMGNSSYGVLGRALDAEDIGVVAIGRDGGEALRVGGLSNFTGYRLTNVADPIDAQDGATKAYVDANVGGASVWSENGNKIYYNTDNVGIGTNDPATPLHTFHATSNSVASFESGDARVNIRFSDNGTTNVPVIGAEGNKINLGHVSGGDKVTILENGNVGIGTNDPAARKLEVVAGTAQNGLSVAVDNGQSGINLELNSTNAGDSTRMSFQSFRTSDGVQDFGSIGAKDGNLVLSGGGNAPDAPHMVINNSGNVGIGTTSIRAKVDIQNSGSLRLGRGNDTVEGGDIRLDYPENDGTALPSFWAMDVYAAPPATASNPGLRFYRSNASAIAMTVMYIGHDGNVGIGTDDPDVNLEIEGASQARMRLTNQNTSGQNHYSEYQMGDTGGVSWAMGYYGSLNVNATQRNNFYIWQYRDKAGSDVGGSGGLARITIKDDGNVGIGAVDPDEKLDVNGNVLAVAYLYSSDARLKSDIKPLTSSLDDLAHIHAYRYHYKADAEKTPRIGVLAQEVKEVFPEIVKTNDDGMMSVDYPSLVPVLIDAVKRLDARTKDLEAANKDLQKQINDLMDKSDK